MIPDNEKRHQLIEDTIFEMEEHWAIPREITGIVITAFIGRFRKALRDGSYETLAKELFEVVKDVSATLDTYRVYSVDERDGRFRK